MATQYASIADIFIHGLPTTARGALSDDQLDGALQAASELMDSTFRGRYNLPLLNWGVEVRMVCCWIAAYLVLSGARGFNPAAGADVNIANRYQAAMVWCDQVQRRAKHPDVVESPGKEATYAQPVVISSSVIDQRGRTSGNRGW